MSGRRKRQPFVPALRVPAPRAETSLTVDSWYALPGSAAVPFDRMGGGHGFRVYSDGTGDTYTVDEDGQETVTAMSPQDTTRMMPPSIRALGVGGAPSHWYLSFAGPDLPKGTQFLGACVVEANNELHAVTVSHELGINPGGEVAIVGPLGRLPAKWVGRLLTADEARNLPEPEGD